MEFLEHTLPNGLEIVAECNAAAYSTALGFFVNTGARDEDDAIAGVSHFLEHMVFKGTPSRSADDVNRDFDRMGAHYNAFTNEENTVYYAAVLPERQGEAVELLADILGPSLREEDFQTEKQVILEEIRMYEDQPPFGADDKCRAALLRRASAGPQRAGVGRKHRPVVGRSHAGIFPAALQSANIILAAAGRIDFNALVAAAEGRCGSWQIVPAQRSWPRFGPMPDFRQFTRRPPHSNTRCRLPPDRPPKTDDRYAAKLLATVLGDDSGSRLFWELVDPGLAEHVSLCHGEHQGAGMMMTSMSCDPGTCCRTICGGLSTFTVRRGGRRDTAELEQAKSKVRSRLVLGQRATPRAAFCRRQRLALPPRVSSGGRRTGQL